MGGYKKAHEIITTHRDSLEKMALALLDRETLNAKEIKEIIDGKGPPSGEQDHKTENPPTVLKKSHKVILMKIQEMLWEETLPDPASSISDFLSFIVVCFNKIASGWGLS